MQVGIIGLGTVGRALREAFRDKVDLYLYDKYFPESELATAMDLKGWQIDDIQHKCEIVFICVPTPTSPTGEQSLDELDEVMAWLHPKQRPEQILVIKSTVLPGTTDKYIKQYNDDYICHMPEFLDEKTALADILRPRRPVVIGIGGNDWYEKYGERLQDLFSLLWDEEDVDISYISSHKTELLKYITNCYYAMKCLFAHQTQEILEAMGYVEDDLPEFMDDFQNNYRIGGNHWKILEHHEFPLGGKCLPKDLRAFATWSHNQCSGMQMSEAFSLTLFDYLVELDEEYKLKYGGAPK